MSLAAGAAVCLGDVSLDEYYGLPHWPGLGDKLAVAPLAPQVGGTIANAACCLAGLGRPVELVWTLNDGDVAARLRAHLTAAGVGTRWIGTDPSLPDSRTLVFLVDGEHTIFLPDPGDVRITLGDALLRRLRAAAIVYTNGIEARRLTIPGVDATGAEILRSLRAAGALVVLDLDVDPEDDAHLATADIVFTNRMGFARLSRGAPPQAVAERLFRLGMGLLVVTRGDEGCTVHGPEGEIHVPGLPVHAVDVTGAGDAFGAAFAHAYATTGDVSLAARFATAAGARATTRLGPQAGVATVGEIVACMEHHGIAGTDDARRLSSHQTAQSRPDAPRPGGAVDGHPARHGGAPAGIAGDRAPHHASSPWEKS